MFVCSVKASTLKLFSLIVAAFAAITVIILAIPDDNAVTVGSIFEGEDSVSFDKVKTEKQRIEFLSQFGWEVSPECIEEVNVQVPAQFDKIMNSYNELQKAQGLDLSKYKGKTVQRYTYKVTNYPNYSGTVYANIIILKGQVIGGDICSSDTQGFIQGFERPAGDK